MMGAVNGWLTSKLSQPLPETVDGCREPSPNRPTLSFGGALGLGLPCKGALSVHGEWEGEKKVWIKRPVCTLNAVIRPATAVSSRWRCNES